MSKTKKYSAGDLFIKDYKVINILGQGAYGTVYKAINVTEELNNENRNPNSYINNINNNSQNFYAIKIFDKDLSKKGIHPSILREIGILKELSIHNFVGIIKLIDVIIEYERIYAIYEYGGSSLQAFVEEKCYNKKILNLEFGIRIFFQIVHSIQFLHNLGIVHRDLKPENILINQDNFMIKIADFGLARSIRNHSHTNYTSDVVTIYYKSPELLDDSNNNSFILPFAIDSWSIGIIALELFHIICTQMKSNENVYLNSYNTRNKTNVNKIFNKSNINESVNKEIIWLPFFYGDNELLVLNSINNFLDKNKKFNNLKKTLLPLYESFPKIFELISDLLQIDPNKRCSCIHAFQVLKEFI